MSNRAAIERLRAKLATVSATLVTRIKASIRDELERHVRAQFAAGLDVDGKAWPERRRRSGGGIALQSLASTVSVSLDGNEVAVRISHPKAIYHQGGWRLRSGKHTPARIMMPGRRRVGREWLKAIRRGADRALRAAAREGKP